MIQVENVGSWELFHVQLFYIQLFHVKQYYYKVVVIISETLANARVVGVGRQQAGRCGRCADCRPFGGYVNTSTPGGCYSLKHNYSNAQGARVIPSPTDTPILPHRYAKSIPNKEVFPTLLELACFARYRCSRCSLV